jgi:two-component system, NtrC family, sensor kinase
MSAGNILILDDEPGITLLCERLLKRADFQTAPYTKPSEALEYIRHNHVDLLLVDIRMPEMNGFELIASVQQIQPDAAILVMTGFGTVETAIQALKQGVDGLILKPFETGDELVKAVNQAIWDSQKKRDIARIQALRPLFDITESLLAETRQDRLLDLILNAVCGHLRCTNAAFYQYSQDDKQLRVLLGRGLLLPEEKSSLTGGVLGRPDAFGLPLLVNVSGPGDPDLQEQVMKLGLVSVLCAPIVRQNVRGILYAARANGEAAFREVEWEMFILLARQAAVAMENARLYAELRDYVQRVEDSQQALIRAEKMSAAGRLTASIAHEINNPLQAVQNCIHLASRMELDIEKRQEYLQMAQTELDRLMSTIQRMLDFYRPGSVEPQKVDIADLIRYVIGLLSPQLEARGIKVNLSFSSRLQPILAVSSQIQQVFLNIILNAYDAMQEGGELTISARPVRDTVEIIFQDSGPGIPLEFRAKIFEPFVSSKQGGLGLGLSVSYGIIEAHGGSLDLVPDRGPGACFRVMLPNRGE